MRKLTRLRTVLVAGLLAGLVLVMASCGGSSKSAAIAPDGVLQVVAAENFWGSIATQLGGSRAHVTSVITSPATDPHDYEPTAADARTLARALGLRLVTPPTFLRVISEGTEPTAADKTTVDRQIADGQIKVWVYNSQNSTPDVKRITDAARKRGIPVTTVTETLVPASASFQHWQSHQLEAVAAALAQATRR